MKLRTYTLTVFVLLLLVAADFLFWGLTATPVGKLNAYVDTAIENRRLKMTGLPTQGAIESRRLLQERYGVSVDQTAGCIYHPWLFRYAESYNAVSESLLNKEFGRDVFKECSKEGYRLFLANHPPRTEEEKELRKFQLKELESY